MSGGVRFVMQFRGYNANNAAVVIEGVDANRVVEFSDAFVLTKDDASTPPRVAVTPRGASNEDLEARIAALEALLVDGVLTIDTIEVRRIIAMGTGAPSDPDVPDLEIVTKTNVPGTYIEMMRFVGQNNADMVPSVKTSWFGATAQAKQTIPSIYNLSDVVNRFEQYNYLEVTP